jgi:hypothetical protein
MNEVGEFNRIANKEYWRIITDDIVVSFFGVEFNGKSTRITDCICRTQFTCNCGETDKKICLLAHTIEKFSFRVLRKVIRYFECSECTGTLRMNYTFRHTFTVEVG